MRHWPIVREALEELLPEFERAGAHKVALSIAATTSGLAATSSETDAAKVLVRFLAGPVAVPVLKKHGLEPG